MNKSQIDDLQEAMAALHDDSSKTCHLTPAQRDALLARIKYLEARIKRLEWIEENWQAGKIISVGWEPFDFGLDTDAPPF